MGKGSISSLPNAPVFISQICRLDKVRNLKCSYDWPDYLPSGEKFELQLGVIVIKDANQSNGFATVCKTYQRCVTHLLLDRNNFTKTQTLPGSSRGYELQNYQYQNRFKIRLFEPFYLFRPQSHGYISIILITTRLPYQPNSVIR